MTIQGQAPSQAYPKIAKILVADDEPNMRELAYIALRERYDVHIVNNGLELIEEFRTRPYDLVLTDNDMPKMNGVDAIAELIHTYGFTDLKYIVFTGRDGNAQEALEKHNLEAHGFIRKPFLIDEVSKTVDDVLGL